MKLFIRYTLLIKLLTVAYINRSQNWREGLFTMRFYDKILNRTQITTKSVESIKDCAISCIRNDACKSFNFQLLGNTAVCDILSGDFKSMSVFIEIDYKTAVGWRHYDTGTGEYMLLPFDRVSYRWIIHFVA